MYRKELAERQITQMITCIECRARSSRTTRSTLKVLKIRIVLKADRFPPEPLNSAISISKILKLTTNPSSQFILSWRYFFGPIALILINISMMKIQVKTEFNFSMKMISAAGWLQRSIAICTVLPMTQAIRKLSQKLLLTSILRETLTFVQQPGQPLGQTLTRVMCYATHSESSVLSPTSRTSQPLHIRVLRLTLQSFCLT